MKSAARSFLLIKQWLNMNSSQSLISNNDGKSIQTPEIITGRTNLQYLEKAHLDYKAQEKAHERRKSVIVNQRNWKRRVKESAWALKPHLVEKLQKELNANVAQEGNLLLPKVRDARPSTALGYLSESINGLVNRPTTDHTNDRHSMIMSIAERSKKILLNSGHDSDEESESKGRLFSKSELQAYHKFLKENAEYVQVLKQVAEDLDMEKLPRHDRPVSKMKDYDLYKDRIQCIVSDDVKEKNIHPYILPNEKPSLKIEELKSWKEVIGEELEFNVFKIPGKV